jgi:murein DD-endopeptidase MepM/ murein hydrolase activator NlpD
MKKLIRESTIDDLKNDISSSGASIKGNEIDNGGNLNPDFINLLDEIFKSGIMKGCKVIVTGGNDEWHKKNAPNSLHTKGNAIDVAVEDKFCRNTLKNYIKKNYPKLSYLDEYENPSPKATAGHLHIQYGGAPLKYDDESENIYSNTNTSSTSGSSSSLLGSFLKGIVGSIKGLNEIVEPISSSSKKVSSNNVYTYRPLNDDDVVSPYDGKVSMISQDQTSKKYSINISHSIEGKKYVSIISGLDSVDVSKGDKVSTNSVIGSVNKNNIITWKVIDENGKSVNVNIIDDNSDDSDDDFLNKKKNSGSYNKHPNIPLPMQTAIKLNPIGMMMRAAKALTNVKESTQEQNVLTEEIQRIKSLMK